MVVVWSSTAGSLGEAIDHYVQVLMLELGYLKTLCRGGGGGGGGMYCGIPLLRQIYRIKHAWSLLVQKHTWSLLIHSTE